MNTTTEPHRWSLIQLILFRFAFAYFILYLLPFPASEIPGVEEYAFKYNQLWFKIVPWFGEHVLHLSQKITIFQNGSGDTTFNYVQLLCFAAISATVALCWSLVDFRRTNYRRLHIWLRVYVRFGLAIVMIAYGAIKVVKSQFPDPSLDRLIQPFGEASPMGLLWTFMGASTGYNIFSGAGEMLGGLLLTTRRTTLLGALVSIGVMSHIVALNFCYDVPVKLFSLNLLAMAIFLAVPDAHRLANMFLWNKPAPSADIKPFTRRKSVNYGIIGLRTAIVVAVVALHISNALESQRQFGSGAPRSPLAGIWSVEELRESGKDRPAVLTDTTRWRRIIFDYPAAIAIQLISDTRIRHGLQLDPANKTLTIRDRFTRKTIGELSYDQPESNRLVLDGTFDGKPIKATLKREDNKDFLLNSRGFHWINEYPFNR